MRTMIESFDKNKLEQIISNGSENVVKHLEKLRDQYIRLYGEEIDDSGEQYIVRNFIHERNMTYDLEQIQSNCQESGYDFKNFEEQTIKILHDVTKYNSPNDILMSNIITLKDKNRLIECIKKTVISSVINKNVNYLIIDLVLMAPVYPKNKGCYYKVWGDSRVEFVKYFNPNETKKVIFDPIICTQIKNPGLYGEYTTDDIITELCKIIIALKDLQQKNLDNSPLYSIEKQQLFEILKHPLFLEVYFILNKIKLNEANERYDIVIDLYETDTGRFFRSCGRRGRFSSV